MTEKPRCTQTVWFVNVPVFYSVWKSLMSLILTSVCVCVDWWKWIAGNRICKWTGQFFLYSCGQALTHLNDYAYTSKNTENNWVDTAKTQRNTRSEEQWTKMNLMRTVCEYIYWFRMRENKWIGGHCLDKFYVLLQCEGEKFYQCCHHFYY